MESRELPQGKGHSEEKGRSMYRSHRREGKEKEKGFPKKGGKVVHEPLRQTRTGACSRDNDQ